ncbi:MarR family transcriptional regulator [Nostocoides sp. Soil756]|uniref:MarR family winged helix-turn-helix transcriptional regulator n=1 Tax=Nostocoides sp. Soil756 TaxID=1736399 RepID=UPI0012F8D584|nr:MarR family transcriptional regulator [Tetrasphaera sp. Soil756]
MAARLVLPGEVVVSVYCSSAIIAVRQIIRPVTVDAADRDDDPALSAVMRASLVFSAVVAASLADTARAVTGPQLRVLVVVATRAPVGTADIAAALDVDPSSATRLIDRVVGAGLVVRHRPPEDRRRVRLELTGTGRALVESVMAYRRGALDAILRAMDDDDVAALTAGLAGFTEAARRAEIPSVGAPW